MPKHESNIIENNQVEATFTDAVEVTPEKKQFTTPELNKLEKVTSLLTDALGHINKVKTRGVEASEELVLLKNMHTILGQQISKLEKK